MPNIEVQFGAMAPRLHDQVGLEAGDLALEQRLADAVVLCAVQGVLTEAEKSRAFKRGYSSAFSSVQGS